MAQTFELEIKWLTAQETGNPIAAHFGPMIPAVDGPNVRRNLAERGLHLTTDHAASSYGQPVAVDAHGNAFGPHDALPLVRHTA